MASVNEIIDLITNSPDLSIEDRASIVRILASTIPDLAVPERRLKTRIDNARAVRTEYVDSAILGLETSDVWQQSAATTPKELRMRREASDRFRLLHEAALALAEVADYNARYNHFIAVDKARAAQRVGNQLTGDAAILVQPHLEIMSGARPSTGRRRVKPTTTTPSTTPPAVKA